LPFEAVLQDDGSHRFYHGYDPGANTNIVPTLGANDLFMPFDIEGVLRPSNGGYRLHGYPE